MIKANSLKINGLKKGFTLLELLFVVAILATIATFALSTYRERTINAKVSQAGLQIQQILQAGTTYYIEKGQWPIQGEDTGKAFEKDYLPFGQLKDQNPWGLPYRYEPTNKAKPTQGLFQVSTDAPSSAVANRVAARLPNAKVKSDSQDKAIFIVDAQVAIPGQQAAMGGILIKKVGVHKFTCHTPTDPSIEKTVDFKCPGGVRHLAVSLMNYEFPSHPSQLTIIFMGAKDVTCKGESPCTYKIQSSAYTSNCVRGSSVSVNYVAYCCPASGCETK